MYLISYFCNMEGDKEHVRKVYWTMEFKQFYNGLPDKVKMKFDYTLEIVKTERVISTKFVKHLENTDLYEMRVSVDSNEYRTILFTMDDDNVMSATEIILLNTFMNEVDQGPKETNQISGKHIKQREFYIRKQPL